MLWYPKAVKQELENSGEFLGGPPKGLLHTTEGSNYPGVSLYHGTQPHFTCDVKRKKCYQHIPINRAAMSLENHPGGIQTNRDGVIQIEIVAFTFGNGPYAVKNWTKSDIEYISELMRWIEVNAKVPRRASVSFSHPVRMSEAQWDKYSGWCGHVHCPENTHVDGTGMPIAALLAAGGHVKADEPGLRRGATGEAVHHLQSLLRAAGYNQLVVDGVFGPGTETVVRRVQKAAHLEVSGVVGVKTWRAIHVAVNKRRG